MYNDGMDLSKVPGSAIIREGIEDLSAGRETVASLLVAMGFLRVRQLGLFWPDRSILYAEHRLYELLARTDADSSHSRYNALL